MRNITAEARRIMNTRRNFVNYAHVTLHDGQELYLKPSDFRISGNSFTDDWNEGDALQLGSAIGKTATILLDNTDGRTEEIEGQTVVYPHGKFSGYDFYMAYFELYIHLPDATHYEGELIDEIIPIGTFTVTTPASHGATIEITGVDNMHMFDRSFDTCNLDFSTNPTLYDILYKCCGDCGVLVGFDTTFLNAGLTVSKKPAGITYREVVSYIAQIAGCNAKISVNGALTLTYYDMSIFSEFLDGGHFDPWDGTDEIVDGGSFNPWTVGDFFDGGKFTDPLKYHNLTATNGTTVSTDDIRFTGIMVSYEVEVNGSTETQSLHYPNTPNWDDYAMQITDNPFITADNANTIIVSLWDILADFTFRVFSCSSLQDPTIEAGDCALVYDVKGNVYPTIITNVTFKTGGMTELSCTAESPVKQNQRYVNPAAKAVAKAKAEMDAYNTQVARFNELAYASTAYYKITKPSEPNVTYLCDQPTIEASTNVVKITGNGAFISTDGGESYNAGLDVSTATMLLNLLYVHGIECDWIHSGTLTLGGASNVNGELSILDADGREIGKWDSDGISASKGTFSGALSGATGSFKGSLDAASGTFKGKLVAGSATLADVWYVTVDGLTNHSDAWVKPNEISCGQYGATLIGMRGRSSGHGGYLEVAVNRSSDYIHVLYNSIERSDGKYAYFWDGSDRRLKKDIEEISIEEAHLIIDNVKPLSFRYKHNDEVKHYGFVAQDIDEQCQELNLENPFVLNNERSDRMKAVDYNQFIAPLIRIVQEQQKQIDELKEQLKNIVKNQQ